LKFAECYSVAHATPRLRIVKDPAGQSYGEEMSILQICGDMAKTDFSSSLPSNQKIPLVTPRICAVGLWGCKDIELIDTSAFSREHSWIAIC
jgi:hypothetical protein